MGIFDKFKNIFTKKDINEYDRALEKTRTNFTSKLGNLSKKYKELTEEYFEELEEILIMADIGVGTVMKLIEKLKRRVKDEKITSPEELKEIIVDEMFITYVDGDILTNKININKDGPTVLLFVGVNGVGKTTTIGKIAYQLTQKGKKVLLIAGDTFRAGAIEQIQEWGRKSSCDVFYKEQRDPASVIYDGLQKGNDYDVILIDTAGRLQNKINLMNELEKINKVIAQIIPSAPHETLLVVDATTGQNGIQQAKNFKEITNITGIVLTKLDGSAKGGIVLAIKDETKIPVKYIGLGEGYNDLKSFDIENYIYGLFKDWGDKYDEK